MNFEIVRDGKVLASEVSDLRKSVGWLPLVEKLEKALLKTHSNYSLRVDERLVGFVRVISDGAIHAFLVDLVVHPDFQHHGLGKALIQKAVNELKNEKYLFIQLTFDKELESFYRDSEFEIIKAGIIYTNR